VFGFSTSAETANAGLSRSAWSHRHHGRSPTRPEPQAEKRPQRQRVTDIILVALPFISRAPQKPISFQILAAFVHVFLGKPLPASLEVGIFNQLG
jgi:hypothetical protein